MNIMHSSRTDSWGTPKHVLDMARQVMGSIDFDPASSDEFNKTVRAQRFVSRSEDGLLVKWPEHSNIWINPPGGKIKNRSVSGLFWDKLVGMSGSVYFKQAIFMAFSAEALQYTQRSTLSLLDFPICVPRSRIKFVYPTADKSSPSHSNVVCYVPGYEDNTDKFCRVFSALGKTVVPLTRTTSINM